MAAVSLPKAIRTERLRLRPFGLDDVDAVHAYAVDEEWSRFLIGVPSPYEQADAVRFVASQVLLDWVAHPTWAVVLDGAVIGGINIRFRLDYLVAEMGWSIRRDLWGRGLATEAARAVVDCAFRTHSSLNRIGATADPRNIASLRVMEKVGMTREGTLRQNRMSRSGLADEACFGLLRAEWEADLPE